MQLFAVSWRNPTPEQRQWSLDTYTEGVVKAVASHDSARTEGQSHRRMCGRARDRRCRRFDAIARRRFGRRCRCSSTFSTTARRKRFRSVRIGTVRVRAKADGEAKAYSRNGIFEMFAMLRVEESVMSFVRSNYLLGEDPLKHPLLFWSMDYTRMPAAFQCDMLDLSKDNKLAKRELRDAANASICRRSNTPSTSWPAAPTTSRRGKRVIAAHNCSAATCNSSDESEPHTDDFSARRQQTPEVLDCGCVAAERRRLAETGAETPGDWRETGSTGSRHVRATGSRRAFVGRGGSTYPRPRPGVTSSNRSHVQGSICTLIDPVFLSAAVAYARVTSSSLKRCVTRSGSRSRYCTPSSLPAQNRRRVRHAHNNTNRPASVRVARTAALAIAEIRQTHRASRSAAVADYVDGFGQRVRTPPTVSTTTSIDGGPSAASNSSDDSSTTCVAPSDCASSALVRMARSYENFAGSRRTRGEYREQSHGAGAKHCDATRRVKPGPSLTPRTLTAIGSASAATFGLTPLGTSCRQSAGHAEIFASCRRAQ